MNNILKISEAVDIAEKLHKQKKSIILVGGCFDILHAGHIAFLEKAKKQGNILFVLLESDNRIKKIKGENRPIHKQIDRARALANLRMVDYVVLLPNFTKNNDYDKLLFKLKPTIIATTKGDPNREHKERQEKLINTQVIDVIDLLPNKSTSLLAQMLSKDKYL